MIPLPDAILADIHPTEDAARQHLGTGQPYRGIWHTPEPYPTRVHLFASDDYPDAMLVDEGWTRDCDRTEPHTCGAEIEESA